MNDIIIERGRGPEIAGTRVTVYDIWDYAKEGMHSDAIAAALRISSNQVRAAMEYIDGHKEEVLAEYQKMLDRDARGNPPDVQDKLARTQSTRHFGKTESSGSWRRTATGTQTATGTPSDSEGGDSEGDRHILLRRLRKTS